MPEKEIKSFEIFKLQLAYSRNEKLAPKLERSFLDLKVGRY